MQQMAQKQQVEKAAEPAAQRQIARRLPQPVLAWHNHSLLRSSLIQAKLAIGAPGDRYEQEADRIADAVLQRQAEGELEEEEEEAVQANPLAGEITPLVQRQEKEPEDEEEEAVQAKPVTGKIPLPIQTQADEGAETEEQEEEQVVQSMPSAVQTQQTPPPLSPMQAKLAKVPLWDQLPSYAREELEAKAYSGDWFDRQIPETRLTILTLYVKLRGMQLWEHIRGVMIDETNQYPGRLNFIANDVNALKQDLRSRWNFRDPEPSNVQKWDSAEKRATGALHFKHFESWPPDKVEAHIDQAGVWLGSKAFWWVGVPVTGLRHLIAYDSYQDPFGIRDILLRQGWDRQTLLGTAAATVQRKGLPGSRAVAAVVQRQIESLRGGGTPLPNQIRALFEPRFGCDFSHVRVHTDLQAAKTAQALNAAAFTVGRDVMFGAGQYAPETSEGRRLLAHELTHVVQQRPESGQPITRLSKRSRRMSQIRRPKLAIYQRHWRSGDYFRGLADQKARQIGALKIDTETSHCPEKAIIGATPYDTGEDIVSAIVLACECTGRPVKEIHIYSHGGPGGVYDTTGQLLTMHGFYGEEPVFDRIEREYGGRTVKDIPAEALAADVVFVVYGCDTDAFAEKILKAVLGTSPRGKVYGRPFGGRAGRPEHWTEYSARYPYGRRRRTIPY